MKLIIKEYLAMLKESKELDALLPELLLAMGHKTISKAQVGPRQYGVDVASVGIDKDGVRKMFLFTIKQGDLSRREWSSLPQDVKQSLDDIIDTYISTHLEKQYEDIPKKVVLVTGGDLKQTVQLSWATYTEKYSKDNEVEFDLWEGDELAILIEKYLFNEHIIPKNLRSKFRKTLALLNDTDYDLRDYYEFLYEILENNELSKKSQKEQIKSFRLIYLALNIIYSWSKEEDNLKHSLLASERTLLNLWGFIHKNNLTKKKKLLEIVGKVYHKNFFITSQYCQKLSPLMKIENGMSFNGSDFLQESLIVFEQLGILASLGSLFMFSSILEGNELYLENAKGITELIKVYINNHKALYNPVYDEHIIDIALVIFLLSQWNEIKFIDEWIGNLISHIEFAYNVNGKYFPIDNNNFDDLVELNLGNVESKEEYIKTSTLIPVLAYWCIKLGLIENYKYIQSVSKEIYKEATLQVWYPDEKLEDYMYSINAGYNCGYVEAPIELPDEPKDLAKSLELINESENVIDIHELSCVIHGLFPLILISSRHFRMPILPQLWNLKKKNNAE